jgi:acyl-coenzyme A thioesterase PaaI-like protein
VSVGDVLTAVAEEESATNRLAFYRVTVLRSDDPSDVVALFRGTVYKTNQEFFPA